MPTWKGIIGKGFTAGDFSDYVQRSPAHSATCDYWELCAGSRAIIDMTNQTTDNENTVTGRYWEGTRIIRSGSDGLRSLASIPEIQIGPIETQVLQAEANPSPEASSLTDGTDRSELQVR